MKYPLLAATIAVMLDGSGLSALAQTAQHPDGHHVVVQPDELRWMPAPPAIPKGAEIALLYGDPTKEGPFAMRLRFPANYRIPPHTHPVPEVVTIISGSFRLGTGTDAARDKTRVLPTGSFFAVPPGAAHFAYVDEQTVVQITTTGPWSLKYVNPEDDPRR